MTGDILVAGVGNIFLGDDGVGVEVARRLAEAPPEGASVVDYGIRGMHLAFALTEPHRLVVIIDAVQRGGLPGTVYVLEPTEVSPGSLPGGGAHGMDFSAVFALVATLGSTLPRLLVIGVEPLDLSPGLGLSEPLGCAVDQAVRIVREVVARAGAGGSHDQQEGRPPHGRDGPGDRVDGTGGSSRAAAHLAP